MTRFPCYTVKDGQHPASHCQGPLWTKSRRVTRCHHQNGWQLAVLVGWLLNVLTYSIHCATDHHHHSSHRYWGNQDCSPYAAAFGCLSLSFLPVTLQQPEHADLRTVHTDEHGYTKVRQSYTGKYQPAYIEKKQKVHSSTLHHTTAPNCSVSRHITDGVQVAHTSLPCANMASDSRPANRSSSW